MQHRIRNTDVQNNCKITTVWKWPEPFYTALCTIRSVGQWQYSHRERPHRATCLRWAQTDESSCLILTSNAAGYRRQILINMEVAWRRTFFTAFDLEALVCPGNWNATVVNIYHRFVTHARTHAHTHTHTHRQTSTVSTVTAISHISK